MSQPDDLMIGWTTVAERADAERLASGLVSERLAACVQISGPIASVYRWHGQVETAAEFRLAVKFARARAEAVAAWLAAHHPYEVPQWLACPAAIVAEKYLKWALDNST